MSPGCSRDSEGLVSQALRPIAERARRSRVPIALRQQRHLEESFVMLGVKVERFAITLDRALVAGGVAGQTQKVPGLRGIGMSAQVRFAEFSRFLEISPVRQPAHAL